MSKCQCEVCTTLRSRQAHVDALPKKHREYFNGLLEHIFNLEFDLDYHNAILSGTWHSADEVLKQSLKKWEAKHGEQS